MKPIEKAKELFQKYCYAIRTEENDSGYFTNVIYAKDCAIIAVDEILNLEHPYVIVYSETSENKIKDYTQEYYWELVKEEIEKL
jgi:ADP-heptose:LPS heptosyltransferase